MVRTNLPDLTPHPYIRQLNSSETTILERTTPAFKAWSMKLLKKKEKELAMGGFGQLPIVEGLELIKEPKKKPIKKRKKKLLLDDEEANRGVYGSLKRDAEIEEFKSKTVKIAPAGLILRCLKLHPYADSSVKQYALGDTSSDHSHMLNRLDVPDNALHRQHLFQNSNTTNNNNNNFAFANKFNVMAARGGPADHYENGLFSRSLSDLFTRKVRLTATNNNSMYGHSVGASHYQHQEEDELFRSLKEIEAQTIGNLLPNDDDLLSGVTDGLDCKVQPGGVVVTWGVWRMSLAGVIK
ncbi:hypothetical protein Tco_0673485 [Tanacetum coccineum]